jgi:Mrp family chromosome partitioning ATPase
MRENVNEGFRKAALALAGELAAKGARSVVFCSSRPGEGTTTVVLNVARHLSETYNLKTLVVELNRRRPVFARLFSLNGLRNLGSGLTILPSGEPSASGGRANDLAALVRQVLAELESRFDIVLFDASPVLEGTDALEAIRLVPRVVLVVQAATTSYEVLDRVARELAAAHASIVGSILNKFVKVIPSWIYLGLS